MAEACFGQRGPRLRGVHFADAPESGLGHPRRWQATALHIGATFIQRWLDPAVRALGCGYAALGNTRHLGAISY